MFGKKNQESPNEKVVVKYVGGGVGSGFNMACGCFLFIAFLCISPLLLGGGLILLPNAPDPEQSESAIKLREVEAAEYNRMINSRNSEVQELTSMLQVGIDLATTERALKTSAIHIKTQKLNENSFSTYQFKLLKGALIECHFKNNELQDWLEITP
jgi:hypothetical protein